MADELVTYGGDLADVDPADYQAAARDEDWLRTVAWGLPEDWMPFLHAIGVAHLDDPAGPEKVAHFLELPAAEAMPPALRVQALAYAAAGPPEG